MIHVCVCSAAQSCLTLRDLMDCSPPGSPVHGILQAKILEWAAIPFSRRSNPCLLGPLHWQADSLPLNHLENPKYARSRFKQFHPEKEMLFSGLHRFSASSLSVPGVSVAVKRTTAPDNCKTGPQRFSLHPRWNIPWEHCDHPLPLPLLPPSGLVISCSFAAQLNYGPLESILPSLIRTVISLAKCLHYSSYYTEWWLLCYLW